MARRARHPGRSGTSLLLAALTTLLAACFTAACSREPGPPPPRDVPVSVDRIAIDDQGVPVVVLEEEGGPRWLPIWIGSAEARSIALEIEERTSPRPNSHDLARAMIRGLDASVERVVVTELRAGTYYAVLEVAIGDRVVEIDARPSDSIAIALRDGAPIFVRAKLFELTGSSDSAEKRVPGREI